MKSFFIFLFVFFSTQAFSCDCPPINKIDSEKLKEYNIVFYGTIKAISPCATNGLSIATFAIEEIYKGELEQTTQLTFDCSSSCMMSFAIDEKWLIYANYKKFEVQSVHFCEHSRKYISNENQDAYAIAISQQTFEEEKKYLQSALGIQPFAIKNKLNAQQSLLKPHNEQPSGFSKILLLLFSFVIMIVIFFVSKKKKNNIN